jgi:hypothetical protein
MGQLCSFAEGYCVDCLQDAHCGDGMACQQNECIEIVPCSSSLDCAAHAPATGVCDTLKRYCVQCRLQPDCADGLICFQNKCVCGDYQDDPEHCGGCGLFCENGCRNGLCRPKLTGRISPGDFSNCGTFCTSVGTECSDECTRRESEAPGAQYDILTDSITGDCSTPILSPDNSCCCRSEAVPQ